MIVLRAPGNGPPFRFDSSPLRCSQQPNEQKPRLTMRPLQVVVASQLHFSACKPIAKQHLSASQPCFILVLQIATFMAWITRNVQAHAFEDSNGRQESTRNLGVTRNVVLIHTCVDHSRHRDRRVLGLASRFTDIPRRMSTDVELDFDISP